MITSRCNLNCDYCVLEDSPDQIASELNLLSKLNLIDHLYHSLGFRRITFSGGEVLVAGGKPRHQFVEILKYLKRYRTQEIQDKLKVRMYTNALLLNEEVADAMKDIVDLVAINVDSSDGMQLENFGRKGRGGATYLERVVDVMHLLAERGIPLKIHSVVGKMNHQTLPEQIPEIWKSVVNSGVEIKKWKFYQYMSYDDPERDKRHIISFKEFEQFISKIEKSNLPDNVKCHFKSNEEMDDSLFNILHYGNAQYRLEGDTWTTTRRTLDLREYSSMLDLFEKTGINQEIFNKHHLLEDSL
jgi:MoaA/NifB/PqqE/SkfB family radical SAM enzyme